MTTPADDSARPSDHTPDPQALDPQALDPRGPGQHGRHERSPSRGWFSRSHLLVAVLCALLGFAIVVQVRQTRAEEFSTLRQDDLVQLLDEITQRNDQLEAEQAQLVLDRNDLASGADAWQVAQRNAEIAAVLAGTVPVQGPGIEIVVREVGTVVPASSWVNLVEELRNAGAEAISIGGVRFGASSWIADIPGGVTVDGTPVVSPVTVQAIGDAQTLEVAIGIRGGALATLRTHDAQTEVIRRDELAITAVRVLSDPTVATPAPDPSASSG